ncbi:hypothetical protein MON41_18555, partial [Roseomonas vastitatis]|nr:hypothetical protein [Pseudoroseomonas vastitatis]
TVVSSPRSASSATLALNSAEYRVRLPVIGSVLLRPNRAYPTVRNPGTISDTKRHAVADRSGILLTLLLSGANTCDNRPFENLLGAVPLNPGKPNMRHVA